MAKATKKKMFTLEYIIKSSPLVLYNCLTTATGLQQWFADTVDNDGNTFFFTWNGDTDSAVMISTEEDDYIRFRWDYQDNDEYFEFRIDKTEITNDTILYVTDFADESEVDAQKRLWDTQIHNLIKRIGAS
ncbi:MAG: START-like domain-containing protein [Chitinophagales bacterium]